MTTAENIAVFIYDRFHDYDIPVTKVEVWETATSCATYAP